MSELKYKRSEFLLDDQEKEETQTKNLKETGASDLGLLFALLLSFIGGLILNVMPCVLPILAIKIFSISQCKNQTKKENRADAFWFSVGVLLTFSVLAIVAILLRETGTSLGWGFQFQYPGFVFGLIVVLLKNDGFEISWQQCCNNDLIFFAIMVSSLSLQFLKL